MPLLLMGVAQVNGSSVAIPSHDSRDIIVVFAHRLGSTTLPTKPTAGGTVPTWIDINTNTGANSNCMRTAYAVASGSDTTTGTWTNTLALTVVVLRGQSSSPIGGNAEAGSTGANAQAPAITMTKTDGTSQLLHVVGAFNGTGLPSLSGYTSQASIGTSARMATKDLTTSDGAVTLITQGSTSAYRGATIEIVAAPESGFFNFM